MAARRSDDRGSRGGGLSRAETLDLCARLASYAEAGGTPRDLVRRAGGDAVGRFPDDIDVLVAAGRMYLMAEELDEAERALRHAVRVASREPHALRLLGEVLLRKGEPVAAHGALSSSVAAGMHDPWTKIWVSRALDYAELLADLGPEGVARDVRQVLGKPGQGPPDDGRRSSLPTRPSAPPARTLSLKQARPIDRGVFFPGDARAELPDLQPDPWALAPGEIVDLPTPVPDDAVRPVPHRDEPAPSARDALGAALASDASWSGDATLDGDPPSETEISAWVPGASERPPAPGLPPEQRKPAGLQRLSAAELVDELPPQRKPAGLQRLSAAELVDEFTEQRKPAQAPPGMAGSSAVTVVRRGPPPLPPEPPPDSSLDDDRTREVVAPPRHAFDDDRTREVISPALRALDDDRTREVVAPRARLADPTYKVRAPAVEVREGPVLITVFGDDAGPGPVTAPPSALIPLDVSSEPSASLRGGPASHEPGPMTAPPSALLPPEPPSLQVPSALFTTGQKLDPAVLDEEPPRPSSAPASAPRPPPPKKLSRLQVVGLRLAAAVAIAAVLAGGFELYKRNRTTKIRAFAAEAAVALHGGGPRGVADAEAALAAAQRINPKSRAVLLGLVRARFFAVLDVDPARLPDLVASMEDAAGAGIPSAEIAFAQVLRASASNDPAGAVEMVTHHDEDPDRASDALYQLAAGAAVEAHDTPAAVERYRAAVKLDPMLLSAHIRLVRALAFTGQLKEARERIPQLMTSWPDRPDLVVLSSLVAVAEAQAAGDDTLPTLEASDPDMLPRPLRAAARVLAKSPVEAAIAKAISEAEVAPMVVLCGEAALRAGFEARAREAAQRAIEITSSYPPAYALAARVALSSGRFEEARQAALRAPADVAAEILSFIAYEAGDPTAMATAAGHRAEAPLPNPVAAGLLRLRAAAPLPKPVLEALTRSDKLWSDIVAMDAALDAGQLAIAETIAAGWTAADKHPIRAARVARLLRYQGKNAAAKDAAESAAPTVAARVEAALAAAEMASARAAALSAAERGRSVEEHWVAVLLLAREGRDGPARLLMRTLRLPLADTPLLLRTVAALALAELHIKNPSAPLFTSLAVWTENPDVARALGIRPTAPAAPGSPTAPTTPDTAPKPPLKGRLPRPTGEDPY